jgi:tRNA (guanine37-N1)-methyltransferase
MGKITFNVLTLFPEMLTTLEHGVVGRAVETGLIDVNAIQIRDFSQDRHKRTDDYPYGGGDGMLMTPQPVVDAWESIRNPGKTICLTPRGKLFNQEKCEELSKLENITLVCGRYEGMDERIPELIADEELSIGDYVISGGEIAAMAVIDAVSRMVPGVLGNSAGSMRDSHSDGLLEYPQYTRPEEFRGRKVPPVLLSGNHAAIREYRIASAIALTLIERPDMLKARGVSKSEAETVGRMFPELVGGIGKYII